VNSEGEQDISHSSPGRHRRPGQPTDPGSSVQRLAWPVVVIVAFIAVIRGCDLS